MAKKFIPLNKRQHLLTLITDKDSPGRDVMYTYLIVDKVRSAIIRSPNEPTRLTSLACRVKTADVFFIRLASLSYTLRFTSLRQFTQGTN